MSILNDLEIFSRVVVMGNMSAAGREMGLSPAVVSKRISHLEKRLGARLIQRTTRQLTLTPTGQGFYDRIVGVLAGIEDAEAFVSGENSLPRGILRVSVPTAFGRKHIAPLLGPFMAKYPHMTLRIDLCDRYCDIIKEGYDVAIRIGELSDSTLGSRKLAPNSRVICAAPSYLKAHGQPETLEELKDHSLLAACDQDLWKLEGPEGAVTLKARSNLKTNSGELVREATMAGMGISLRSTWDIGEELKNGRLVRVLPKYRESSLVAIYAVFPSREYIPVKVSVFLDFCVKTFGVRPYWNRGLETVI